MVTYGGFMKQRRRHDPPFQPRMSHDWVRVDDGVLECSACKVRKVFKGGTATYTTSVCDVRNARERSRISQMRHLNEVRQRMRERN